MNYILYMVNIMMKIIGSMDNTHLFLDTCNVLDMIYT